MTTETLETDKSEEEKPKKLVKEHRMKEIKIRLLEDEHAKLMQLKIGKKLAPWIRSVALGVEPIRIDKELVLAVGRLGSNLNQIAKHANTHQQVDVETLGEIKHIRELLQQVINERSNEQ